MKTKIVERLQDLGIDYKVIKHAAVFTVEEAKVALPDKYPVKNLLLKEEKGDRLVFVIMNGDKRLDTKLIASELGARKLQFAKPDVLKATLGVEPGAASLFSLLHDGADGVEVIIDQDLIDQPQLGFHPNINTETITISGSSIKAFLSSLVNKVDYIKL